MYFLSIPDFVYTIYYAIIGLGGWIHKMAIFAYYHYIVGGSKNMLT